MTDEWDREVLAIRDNTRLIWPGVDLAEGTIMTPEPPDDGERDYEHLFRMHPPIDFDMAADLGRPPAPLLKDYTLDTVVHAEMVFDGMPSEWIDCRYQYDSDNPPANPTQEIAEVAGALTQYERSLGGNGFVLDRAHSSAAIGTIVLVLRRLRGRGAAERLRTIADALGFPLANGLPQSNGQLPEAIARPIQQAVAQPQNLEHPADRIRRPGVALRFHVSAA